MRTMDALPRQRPGVRCEPGDGTTVLVCLDGDRHVLNPTARALWEVCDGHTTVEEMVWAVRQLFDVDPTQAETDVNAVLDQLENLELIEVVIQIPEPT
jgi:coenzyme PQQ synthesis protein D (PqqD)